jgi:hypothetical protein
MSARVYTLAELGALLGLSPAIVYDRIRAGELRAGWLETTPPRVSIADEELERWRARTNRPAEVVGATQNENGV